MQQDPSPRWIPGIVLAALLAVAAAPPGGAEERALELDGQTLVLNGAGTRERFGIDVYRLGLYLAEPTSEAGVVRSPDRAKAFRYEMLWPGPVPDDHPQSWQEELLPVLTDAQAKRLRENLDTLDPGDVLWISYVPGEGTTVRSQGKVLVRDPTHEVMGGYLDLWLGPEPVSEGLRDQLLAGGNGAKP